MDKEEVFYVNIKNSHNLRRGILETSKHVIESLHRFEKFKKIRAERVRAVEQLILNFREINELAAQIKIDMPKIKLPKVKEPKKKEEKEDDKKPAEIPHDKKYAHESDDELKKLEAAISQIEARLGEIK